MFRAASTKPSLGEEQVLASKARVAPLCRASSMKGTTPEQSSSQMCAQPDSISFSEFGLRAAIANTSSSLVLKSGVQSVSLQCH